MKYQLLLVLTIIIVNLVQSKTLSHAMKNRATQRRAQSDDIITKIIKVNILTIGSQQEVPEVNLGYGIDITNMNQGTNNMVSSCFAPVWIAQNKATRSTQYSSSKTVLVKDKTDDLIKVSGAIEIAIDAKVAKITGKASIDYESSDKKANAKAVVKDVFAEFTDTLDISKVAESDLNCDPNVVNITHIVTKIVRGKMFSAEVTSESNTQSNNVTARGELEAKLLSIPINGKGSVNFDSKKFSENYTFRADIKASGGISVNSATNVEDFYKEIKSWLDSVKQGTSKDENNVAISYELHPISTYKSFGDRKVSRTAQEQMMLSRAIPIYNQMRVLEEAMRSLKASVPSSMLTKYAKKFYAVQNQILEVKTAIKDNTIKQEMIEKYDDESSVSSFMNTDYYKTLVKKIEADKQNVKDGTYNLSFDGEFLTPNKALSIEYSQLGGGQCKYRGFFGRRLAEGRNRRLDQEDIDKFVCNINLVTKSGTYQPFDDKLGYIDASKVCKNQVIGNYVANIKYGDITNKYYKKDGKTWIHMSYTIDLSNMFLIPIVNFPFTKHSYTDCVGNFYIQAEYKDSDLPYFHFVDTYSPVQKMHYN